MIGPDVEGVGVYTLWRAQEWLLVWNLWQDRSCCQNEYAQGMGRLTLRRGV